MINPTETGDDISKTWLENILTRKFDSNAKLNDIKMQRIGLGRGFASKLYSIDLIWNEEDQKLPNSAVVKLLKMESEEDNWMCEMHETERKAYEFLQPIPNLAIPKFFHHQSVTINQPGVLVMESLAKNGTFVPYLSGFSLEQVLELIDNLAKIHIYCIEHSEESWQKSFEMDFPFLQTAMNNQLPKVWETIDSHEDYRNMLEPVKCYFEKDSQLDKISMKVNKELGLPPVLVHSDLWSSNIIFEEKNRKASDHLLAIVDWQTCQPGNICEDISRILIIECQTEMRRSHTDSILSYYYEKLNSYASKPLTFGLDQVKMAYERMTPHAMVWCAVGISLAQMEGANDRDGALEIALRKTQDVIDDIVKMA